MDEGDNRQPSFEELCLYEDAWAVLSNPNNNIETTQNWDDPNSEAIVICSGTLRSKKPGRPLYVELEAYLFEGNETFAFWPRDNKNEQYIISRYGVEACNNDDSYSHLTDEKIKQIRFWLKATNWIKIDTDDPMGSEQQP